MAHSESDTPDSVEPADGCPNCDEMFANGWRNRVDGNAKVFRGRDSTLVASIKFACPECNTPLLMEDAGAAMIQVDPDRA